MDFSDYMNKCRLILSLVAYLSLQGIVPAAVGQEQEKPKDPPLYEGRIVTAEEVKQATKPASLSPLRVISHPHRFIVSGIEKGLISFEKNNMRQRLQMWTEYLRSKGIAVLLGGLGEGSGFGGGGSYTLQAGERQTLRFLGRGTFKGYEEVDVRWSSPFGKNELLLEGSYQWRPQENFYGLGQQSLESQRSDFALRQTWTGLGWRVAPVPRIRAGAEYKMAWLSALPGTNEAYSSPGEFFPGLPGFGTQTRLQSFGTYLDLDGLRGEYRLGGMFHAGASYQEGLAASNLRYFRYEIQGEGRLPIASGRSTLVGSLNVELNRERSGSSPLPFYLQPHIGGSSTLRGFALDRFYGKNVFLALLEYRYRLHPNLQTVLFFDEGQIFDRTAELSWTNWKRNVGFGFRLLSVRGTYLRIENAWSKEGYRLRILFGDREPRPLGGPIRYGTYRR